MLARNVVGGRLDPPFYPTKTSPCFIGRKITIPEKANVERIIKDTFYMSHDLEFYALSFKSDSPDFRDYWHLMIDGEVICNKLHCMSYEEGLYLQVAHPVTAGSEIYFEYNTSDGKAREVELLFHFLTEPNTTLQLTGTTDLGHYPDPPAEPVDTTIPYPTPGDIQLPVVWSPFNKVADAEEWAKNLGVNCDFGTNVKAANYVTEALALLLNSCGGFAGMIKKHPLNINIKNGNGANGYFNPPTEEVVVSKSYNFEHASEITQMEYDSGQKSSPNRLRTIIHEIGHWLHYNHVGASLFYKYSSLDPDAYGDQTILTSSETNYIADNLCQYATKWFPIELIPEVFTAKITGIPVDPKIWEWYEQYGGYKCEGW